VSAPERKIFKRRERRAMKSELFVLFVLAMAAVACVGCGEEAEEATIDGEGQYRLTVYGEAFIEDVIPADATDGWEIDFEEFLIVVGDVEVMNKEGESGALSEARVFDLTKGSGGGGHEVSVLTVGAGDYDALSYTVAPSSGAVAGNAAQERVDFMKAMSYGIYVKGKASKEGVEKRFAWGFGNQTRYVGCEVSAAVRPGAAGESQMTIHSDHLFYDDLVSEEPNVAFELVASADADGDGEVTLEELSGVDLAAQERYQVGSLTEVTNLRQFIEAQTRTVGHIDGEGHCDVE
jgi:hypothetical protein